MPTDATAISAPRKSGLAFWMERVLEECDRASVSFAPDPVHDLRVALRRCRSMADGLMAMDPDPAWKEMKKAGKRLFSRLGDLRDAQVMQEWTHHFDSPGDPVTSKLLEILAFRESQWKQEAAQALQDFDRKQWRKWSALLPRRAAKLRAGGAIFKHLALERWTAAHDLHREALRNRSQASFHQLRIGLKRFRYIVENFLHEQHAAWGADLKTLQDCLGEIHDLDVLWATAQQAAVFSDAEARARWHGRIQADRTSRVEQYRQKMVGPGSLWQVWRAALPSGAQMEAIALQRLRLWASFLDPDFKHSTHVARLALQLYDGLAARGYLAKLAAPHPREILRLAALLHDVGRAKGDKGHHKATCRLIARLVPPLGVDGSILRLAGIVARYHRGALPQARHTSFAGLSAERKQDVQWLAAILRLANAFDAERDSRVQRLEVGSPALGKENGLIVVRAQGYSPRDRLAEDIAAARHLLEIVCRRPVMVRTMRPRPTNQGTAVKWLKSVARGNSPGQPAR